MRWQRFLNRLRATKSGLEQVWVKLHLLEEKLLVGCVYRLLNSRFSHFSCLIANLIVDKEKVRKQSNWLSSASRWMQRKELWNVQRYTHCRRSKLSGCKKERRRSGAWIQRECIHVDHKRRLPGLVAWSGFICDIDQRPGRRLCIIAKSSNS
jgi:hypothetical protein